MRKYRSIKNVVENRRIVASPNYRNLGTVLLFIFLLPYVVSILFGGGNTIQTERKIFEEDWKDTEFIVCNVTSAGTEKMPLETYLTCRLPEVISMEYEEEALKAQAVVLRTEVIRMYDKSSENREIYVKSSLSLPSGEDYERSRKVVEATGGMYLTYHKLPVKAPYFAVSAGMTRNGNEVLKSEEYPYLRAVMCERDFMAKEYNQTIKMSKTVFWSKLTEAYPKINADREKKIEEVLVLERDRADYVTQIYAGNVPVAGESFRAIFSLNSACFTLEEEQNMLAEDSVIIRARGIGHGLGFCQYAANEAAKKGSDFIDIINYFFTDIIIEKTE